MTYEQLRKHVQDFFGDTSRPASATKRDLLSIRDEIDIWLETLPSAEDLEIGDDIDD